jgi:hypothetical protein
MTFTSIFTRRLQTSSLKRRSSLAFPYGIGPSLKLLLLETPGLANSTRGANWFWIAA